MPFLVEEAVPLEATLLCGVDHAFLTVQDVYAAGCTCISLLYCASTIRTHFLWCDRCLIGHQVNILAHSEDPFRSLLVFDNSLQYALGMLDGQEEFFEEAREFGITDLLGDTPEINWRGFILFREWEIYHGLLSGGLFSGVQTERDPHLAAYSPLN